MSDVYIRFGVPVTPISAGRLISVVDEAIGNGLTKIHLLINSVGGNVSDGFCIFNSLKGVPPNIEIITYNTGSVQSIANVIYCAGSIRICTPYANFFMHSVTYPFGPSNLDKHIIRGVYDNTVSNDSIIAQIIADTINKTPDDILKTMESNTTFSVEKAVEYGLVQRIQSNLTPKGAPVVSITDS